MFDNLSERLQGAFKKLSGKARISEAVLQESLREVRLALLEADVNITVVKALLASIKEKALGEGIGPAGRGNQRAQGWRQGQHAEPGTPRAHCQRGEDAERGEHGEDPRRVEAGGREIHALLEFEDLGADPFGLRDREPHHGVAWRLAACRGLVDVGGTHVRS